MNRFSLIVCFLVVLVFARWVGADSRPNILFIFTDDQRADTIGALGNELILTPNIDKLYENGTHFTRAYCMGSMHGAVCVPSRAMLMSGKSIYHTNMQLDQQTTFPELLGNAGYRTFGTGKWHNGKPSFQNSFQQGETILFGGMSNHAKVPINDMKQDGSLTKKRQAEGFSSTIFADAAVDFLEQQDAETPFLCYVAFSAPHDPRMPPAPYDTTYRGERLPPLPDNFMPQHPFNTGAMVIRDEVLGAWPRTETMIREQTADYYGMITHMDEQIGRLLKTLDKQGLRDNTIVVFAADHGLAMGSHGLLGKQSLYEHSMKTPVCVAGPGIPAGQSLDEFIYLFDLFPTVCDYAGITVPEEVEGMSLRPLIEGKTEKTRPRVFTTYDKLVRAVRDDRWKLIRWPKINKTQLFDLENDPLELNDLSNHEDQQERVLNMTMHLADLQKVYGDTQPLMDDKKLPLQIDLKGVKRNPDRWQPKWIIDKYFEDISNEN
ncbi:MAG: sulfatase-like hydrolase/transferase [Pirellulaceae bacterium]|nr:sulfatase-like hydrolase/transferase [Pirellulaceae bacterium]